jgi:glutamate dehydrogenase (NAD(P)+)
LGNVGFHAAKFLSEEDGCRVVGVIERDGAIWDPNGISIAKLKEHLNGSGSISGFGVGEYIENGTKVLEYPCDILIPAALEVVINVDNAPRIKAKVIAEAANGIIPKGHSRSMNPATRERPAPRCSEVQSVTNSRISTAAPHSLL